MPNIDPATTELIRRHSRWFARLANRIVGWTTQYCSGGCGYPVTGTFSVDVDEFDGVQVKFLLCQIDGECQRNVLANPRDEEGTHYADIRPELRKAAKELGRGEGDVIRLSFTR